MIETKPYNSNCNMMPCKYSENRHVANHVMLENILSSVTVTTLKNLCSYLVSRGKYLSIYYVQQKTKINHIMSYSGRIFSIRNTLFTIQYQLCDAHTIYIVYIPQYTLKLYST